MKPEIRKLAYACLSEGRRNYLAGNKTAIENALELLLPSQRHPRNYEYIMGDDMRRLGDDYELIQTTTLASILKGRKDDTIRISALGPFIDTHKNPEAIENQILMALAKTREQPSTNHYADDHTKAAHSMLEHGLRREALRHAKRAAETAENLQKFKELQTEYAPPSSPPASFADYQTLIERRFNGATYIPDEECPRYDVEPSKADFLAYFNGHSDKDITRPQDRIDACVKIFESFRTEAAKNAVLAGSLAYIRDDQFEMSAVPKALREVMDRIGAVDEKGLRQKIDQATRQKENLEYILEKLELDVNAEDPRPKVKRAIQIYLRGCLKQQRTRDDDIAKLRRTIDTIKKRAGIKDEDDKTLLRFMRFLRLQKDLTGGE